MARWLVRAGALAVMLTCGSALASVSFAVSWDALLHESSAAALVTPAESRAAWEGDHIFTYTHVRVDRGVAGELATGSDAWVRTLGGVVGKVGQLVEGEAVLTSGQPALLFLHPSVNGSFEVTARGQGQFPVVSDDKPQAHLIRSFATGALVLPRGKSPPSAPVPLAADRLHGRFVDDAARDIAAEWGRTHAP